MRQIALLFSLAALAAGCTPTAPPPSPTPSPPAPAPAPAPAPSPKVVVTPVPSFIDSAPKETGTQVATAATTVKVVDNTPVINPAGADVTMKLTINDPALAAAFAANQANEAKANAAKAQAAAVAAEQARQRALQVAAAKREVAREPAAKRVKLEMQQP